MELLEPAPEAENTLDVLFVLAKDASGNRAIKETDLVINEAGMRGEIWHSRELGGVRGVAENKASGTQALQRRERVAMYFSRSRSGMVGREKAEL
jgi:hypothetical protein